MLDGILVINPGGQVVSGEWPGARLLGLGSERSLAGSRIPADHRQSATAGEQLGTGPAQCTGGATDPVAGGADAGREGAADSDVSALLTQGNLHGMIIILSDITQLKQSERKRTQTINFSPRPALADHFAALPGAMEGWSRSIYPRGDDATWSTMRAGARSGRQFRNWPGRKIPDQSGFHETDFVSIAHNAVDEAFAEARSKEIRLIRTIEVDGSLVERRRGTARKSVDQSAGECDPLQPGRLHPLNSLWISMRARSNAAYAIREKTHRQRESDPFNGHRIRTAITSGERTGPPLSWWWPKTSRIGKPESKPGQGSSFASGYRSILRRSHPFELTKRI